MREALKTRAACRCRSRARHTPHTISTPRPPSPAPFRRPPHRAASLHRTLVAPLPRPLVAAPPRGPARPRGLVRKTVRKLGGRVVVLPHGHGRRRARAGRRVARAGRRVAEGAGPVGEARGGGGARVVVPVLPVLPVLVAGLGRGTGEVLGALERVDGGGGEEGGGRAAGTAAGRVVGSAPGRVPGGVERRPGVARGEAVEQQPVQVRGARALQAQAVVRGLPPRRAGVAGGVAHPQRPLPRVVQVLGVQERAADLRAGADPGNLRGAWAGRQWKGRDLRGGPRSG